MFLLSGPAARYKKSDTLLHQIQQSLATSPHGRVLPENRTDDHADTAFPVSATPFTNIVYEVFLFLSMVQIVVSFVGRSHDSADPVPTTALPDPGATYQSCHPERANASRRIYSFFDVFTVESVRGSFDSPQKFSISLVAQGDMTVNPVHFRGRGHTFPYQLNQNWVGSMCQISLAY